MLVGKRAQTAQGWGSITLVGKSISPGLKLHRGGVQLTLPLASTVNSSPTNKAITASHKHIKTYMCALTKYLYNVFQLL